MDYKTHLRSEVLLKRDAMSREVRAQKSELISKQLFCHINRSTTACSHLKIAVFESMRTEVNLQPFINEARSRAWYLCFPCVVRSDENDMISTKYMAFFHIPFEQHERACEIFLSHPMRIHSRSMLVKEGFNEIKPSELDVVIVPLVAFDNDGNRLGYGGGNYDRLLPQLRDDAAVLGVAFEEQRVASVPCEPKDKRWPIVVSA